MGIRGGWLSMTVFHVLGVRRVDGDFGGSRG